MCAFYGACVSRRLPTFLPLSPAPLAQVLSVRDVFQDDGWCQGTLLRGVPGGVQGVSGGVSIWFRKVPKGFRDDLTHRFSKIEGVSSGPAKP